MIRFFPMPYPDENLYSIFTRYNKLTGNRYNNTIKELTGKLNHNIIINYSNNINFLCDQLPNQTLFTPDYFIENHTILPFYKSFVHDERFETTINNIKNQYNTANPLKSVGYISLFGDNCIYCCRECIKEDKELYGEAFIHRRHQIDGNFICTKHNSFLVNFGVPTFRNYFFYDINSLDLNYYNKENLSWYHKELLILSNTIDVLFDNYCILPSYSLVREKYTSIFGEKGYLLKDGRINQLKLHNDFIEYYSKDFLLFIKSYPDINKYNWIRKITVKLNTPITIHPIKHLLLINFLFNNFTNFLNYQVKSLQVNNIYKRRKPYFMDKSKKIYNSKKAYHQNKLIELLKQEPNLHRKQIYCKISSSYNWLVRNEKEWLEKKLPSPLRGYQKRIDWTKRDTEIYLKTFNVINKILTNNIPEKISSYSISKHINFTLTKENLSKMPKTKELVEKYSESYPDFNKRKFEAYIQDLVI